MLEIRLFGQFEVQRDDTLVEIPSRPAQSLLAYLVLNPGIAHRREKLAGLLWPDSTEANARSYLRKALWQIRKSLAVGSTEEDEYLLVDDISIGFNSQADYWLDANALRYEITPSSSIEDQIKSLSVYKGELLPGFYEDWITPERERQESVFEQKVQGLLDRLVEEGRWTETLDWGERWISLGSMP